MTAEAHEKDFLPPMEAMPTNSGERTAASMEDDLDSSAKEAENTNEDLVPPVDVVGDNAAGFVESQFDSQDPFSDSLECR